MRPTARIKNLVRPLVFAARRAGWTLRRRLRPPRPWDGEHDPALLRIEPWSGETEGKFSHDFLGARTDPSFRPQIRPDPAGSLTTDYPPPQYEYLELVFTLESVLAAAGRGRMTVMELGAGYGKWLVSTYLAAGLLDVGPVRLVGAEMAPRHFTWMREHLENNEIDPAEHRLIHAAVSDRNGEAWFQPEPDASTAYGQRVIRRHAHAPDGADRTCARPADGLEPVRVPCLRLRDLLRSEKWVDLVHCDIQGEELRALSDARKELKRRVGRLLVGTHSHRIHRRLRAMLRSDGWESRWDFGVRCLGRTPYGDVRFLDGLLACVNRPAEEKRRAAADQNAKRSPN